jgi:hypothetical protein
VFQVQEMIELALDALPSYDDVDTPPRQLQQRSNADSDLQSKDVVISPDLDPFDKELCMLADEESSID